MHSGGADRAAVITRIETPRLILRKARPDDLDAIWRNVWRDEAIARWMLWEPTRTREDAEARMARTIAYQQTGNAFFACLRETDEPIGYGGVFERKPGVWEDTGICVCAKCRNQGYGREIVRALCALAFDRLGGERFVYSCFSDNARSADLCRSLGFAYTHSEDEVRKWDEYAYVADFYELMRENYVNDSEVDFHD